jgi:hypothetical protein
LTRDGFPEPTGNTSQNGGVAPGRSAASADLQEDSQMTGIAIARPRTNGARILAAMLLVTIGLVLGFAFAQLAATTNIGSQAVAHQAPAALTLDEGYQAQRAGERAGNVPLSGNAAYQAQRAGERSSTSGAGDAPGAGWQAQRAGERGSTP